MGSDGLKVLCTGDLHVGRRSSRLPEDLDSRGCSCAAVWDDVVDLALREKVALVAVSGDVVDRANRFYEAYGPLERGVRKLGAAGIQTYAVAGNHDFDVLPRLAANLSGDGFRLLGADGQWERATFRRNGRDLLHLDGWSFNREHVPACPLTGYKPAQGGDGVPVLGLLHADLDQIDSRYAPVSLAELQRLPLSLWLLGHIHKPALHVRDGCPYVLYPGSPQAMDPGETGKHGAWVLTIKPDRSLNLRHVPLSKVRYETLDLDVEGVDDEKDLESLATGFVRKYLLHVFEDCGPLRYVSLRLALKGRTKLHRRLPALAEPLCQQLRVPLGDVTACVERVEVRTRPAVDLRELEKGSDPPAVLARMLLAMQAADAPPAGDDRQAAAPAGDGDDARIDAVPHARGSGEAQRQLVREAMRRMSDVWTARPYFSVCDDAPPTERQVRGCLVQQGYSLLDALLAQKEEGAA